MPALLYRFRQEKGLDQILELALYGRTTPADKWVVNEGEGIIAYFFKPFSLAPIFNLSAKDLKAEPMDLSGWNAHKTNALRIDLATSSTVEKKRSALERLLVVQLQEQAEICELIHKVTERIMNDSDKDILSIVRKELDVNERTLQRIFKKFVGVTPNQFRRICQFQLSFTKVRGGRFDNLTNVAFESGFADQSHFIRTFKEFTKTRPREYLKTGLKHKRK